MYKSCWRMISVILIVVTEGCVTAPTQRVSPQVVRNQYCQGNHQIRQLKFDFVFESPKYVSGLTISQAAEIDNNIASDERDLFRELLFDLAVGSENFYRVPFLRTDDPIQNVISSWNKPNALEIGYHDSCRLRPIFLQSNRGRITGYYFDQCGNRGAGTSFNETDFTVPGKVIRLKGLSDLIDDFIILEPPDFQTKVYGSEIGGDLYNREQIWKRYIEKFTEVKETEVDSGSKVQLSLDLNGFCRYGRPVTDLIAR